MSARFVAALTGMIHLADELADVIGSVIMGPPSRAVVHRDVKPSIMRAGSPLRVGMQAPPLTAAEIDAMTTAPPGLVPCSSCGTEQARRETGGPAVHYPTLDAIRPCVGSWPARPAAKGRAA